MQTQISLFSMVNALFPLLHAANAEMRSAPSSKIQQKSLTDAGTALDDPALQLTVGVTGMVDESTVAAAVFAVHKQAIVQLHDVKIPVRGGQLQEEINGVGWEDEKKRTVQRTINQYIASLILLGHNGMVGRKQK